MARNTEYPNLTDHVCNVYGEESAKYAANYVRELEPAFDPGSEAWENTPAYNLYYDLMSYYQLCKVSRAMYELGNMNLSDPVPTDATSQHRKAEDVHTYIQNIGTEAECKQYSLEELGATFGLNEPENQRLYNMLHAG